MSGNANKFSARELERQAARLEDETAILLIKLRAAKGYCEDIAGIVKSEDSSLERSWTELGKYFEEIRKKYDKALDTMIEKMKKYAAKTLKNEEEMAKTTTEAGSEISEIASFLQEIDI